MEQRDIIIYRTAKGPELKVKLKEDSIWLTQAQVSGLFQTERSVITKHLNNIFDSGELRANSNVQKMHIPFSDKPVKFYSLDVIISVGYRVNSKRATQFRIWATKILTKHLIDGYTINEKRLRKETAKFKELQRTIAFLREKAGDKLLSDQAQEILDLLATYAKSLSLLDQYDKNRIAGTKGKRAKYILTYEHALEIAGMVKADLSAKRQASDLFGREMDHKFESIVKNLWQTFGGKELYGTIEEKAAHLIYLTIKDHPFTDGNKRIAAFLFIYFLDKNRYLHKKNGERKINDNALVALALLIAVSNPGDKDIMIKIIKNLIG